MTNVITEPVGNSDKMTLTELAHELRKIFKFRYLVVDRHAIALYPTTDKPEWLPRYEWWTGKSLFSRVGTIDRKFLLCDLSEYADENGNIDYSKCIVEV